MYGDFEAERLQKISKKVHKRSSIESIVKKVDKSKADELRNWMDTNGITTGINIDGDSKRYGSAELYVERPGYETNKRVNKRRLIHDAEEYIIRDPQGADGRLKMAKLLGRNMRNAPDADVEDFLMNIASKEPEKIINLYRGDDIALRLLFIDAKDKRVIYVKNKVYLYSENQIVLGATDDAVISWMKNPTNAKVLELIKRDVYPEFYDDKGAKK